MTPLNQISSVTRAKVWDAVTESLHWEKDPQLFAISNAHQPGDVAELERHLDSVIEIARRTTAKHIEPYLFQFIEEICETCPHQSPCAFCPVRASNACVLFKEASTIVDAVANALLDSGDPDYLRHHPFAQATASTSTPQQAVPRRLTGNKRHALPILVRAQVAIRAGICHSCPRRPEGAEDLPATQPLACEDGCELFRHLPRLVETARCVDPMVGSFAGAVNTRINEICESVPPPPHDNHGPRPLQHHRQKIIEALARVAQR